MIDETTLEHALEHRLDRLEIDGLPPLEHGKVREIARIDPQHRLLIVSDRVSAFDRNLGLIPCKGQLLNQLSNWWFSQTKDILPNHLSAPLTPRASLVREAEPLPVEIVLRGYITGVTDTSLWTLYDRGQPLPYGLTLPTGLSKNDPLPEPLITPTTKAPRGEHDQRLSREQILEQGLVEEGLYLELELAARRLFARGQQLARRAGLLLVDTKYEFGLIDGKLHLIDELHTPDSSRYWDAQSYEDDRDQPRHLDKEFMRLWFAQQGYRGEGEPPALPDTLAAEIARRYIEVYERLTGLDFEPALDPPGPALLQALRDWRDR